MKWALLRVVRLLHTCVLSVCGTEGHSEDRKEHSVRSNRGNMFSPSNLTFGTFVFYSAHSIETFIHRFRKFVTLKLCTNSMLFESESCFLRHCRIGLCLVFSFELTVLHPHDSLFFLFGLCLL